VLTSHDRLDRREAAFVRSSARGSRCCSRNILLNTSLEDGHGGGP